MEVDGSDLESCGRRVEEMCRRLLANPVIEDFEACESELRDGLRSLRVSRASTVEH